MILGLFCVVGCGKKESATDCVVFGAHGGSVIAIPEHASPADRRAAEMIQETLAAASGRPRSDFPLIRQTMEEWARPARKLGSTVFVAGTNHRRPGEARLEEKVWWRVADGSVEISSYPADAIEAAAASFLRDAVGVRWFMPGELGAHVPAKSELRLPFGERAFAPSYISRNLGLGSGEENAAWWSRNRLRSWFAHGHAMTGFFKSTYLRLHPDFAPLVNGAKFFPAPNDGNWQPNIVAEGAADHVASALSRRREFSASISLNDSFRFDQSAQSRAVLGEDWWFRQRPDYSRLYFGFVNEVAKRVPGRYLGAYAYDWTENTPGFPIERNVVPYLTADRSEWFDPDFAAEDKALIKRWAASGAEVVGIYDYYYGAPFLVPRPTLYAVKQGIPFAHEAGVRAFYAEVNSNWGLDGPKAWLAAELLWNAKASPEDLLDIYYRDFWQEAADPMRAFYALCDRQWLEQPKPSYWLKYFKDEHQHLLFPAEVRQKLRSLLDAAKAAAQTDLTKRRVEFTSGAFAVTEAFCAWQEAKEKLSRLALTERSEREAIRAAWAELDNREGELKATHARVMKSAPLAVKATFLPEYERNDPRRRAAWKLRGVQPSTSNVQRAGLGDQNSDPQGRGPSSHPISAFSFASPSPPSLRQVSGLSASGQELLKDASLTQLAIKPPATSFDLEWVTSGAWRGHGEPWETRRVSVERPARTTDDGRQTADGRLPISVLRFAGCKQETFSQMVPAEAGKYYLARVKVRAKVSPGNMTFLILNFQDAAGRPLGVGVVDRLPVGEWGRRIDDGGLTTDDGVELVVWAQAPKDAKWVGLGVRALNQVGDDYAAFSSFSLQALVP